MYQRILVATDGSPLSDKAVADAIDLAASLGAELIALKVVARYPRSYFDGGQVISVEAVDSIEGQWNDQAMAVVEAVGAKAKAKGVSAKAITTKSDLIAEAIIAAATKHQCDLIVMASHGRKGIQRMLLGSETQHVLTHTAIPVLVLR